MKKFTARLSSIILLVFSILFGALITFSPTFADKGSESAQSSPTSEGIGQILGGLPSTDPDQYIPSDDDFSNFFGVDDNGDDGYSPSDDDFNDFFGDDDNYEPSDDTFDDFFGDDDDDYEPSDDDFDNIFGSGDNTVNTCQDEGKGASWFLCTAFEFATNASDNIYNILEGFLVIEPLTTDTESATYRVWDYIRGFTNIIFVIFLIIVIYSQITGLGINNYGIKRILPRLIIAVILVNLSYIICALLVDTSNVIGSGISTIFEKIITDTGLNNIAENALFDVDWSQIYAALTVGGAALAAFTIGTGGLSAAFFTALILIIGVFFSILSGVLTIGLRQVMVTLLVIIAPLAFVSYLLPNTEKWFAKWKNLLAQMIFFYPIFAMLFNASKLAGLTIIGSSDGDILKVIVGLAVQVLPLFLSVSLLKMSGTILGKVSSGLDKAFGYAAKPLQGWSTARAEQSRQRYLRQNLAPGSKLRNYLMKRQLLREMNTQDNKENAIGRATEAALNKRASYLGIDEEGNVQWSRRANHYTRAAARANAQKLATTAAQARLANSLSDHGSLFDTKSAARISARSAEAFKELTVQEFWRENIGQNDQEYLINEYLKAIDDRGKGNNYRYNRLIMGAAGGYGYKGEKTIIGQVVKRSADIEARRRAEAAIVINKFGYNKEFRNMMFDRLRLNDNGFAVDENNEEIEDINYRPKDGKTVEKWNKYIYVDRHNKRIDRDKGDKMSDEQREKKGIRKIRYSDIYDDKGNVVSHVYEDDAGYVKEMIMNDMMIGDPIALRYATEIGLMRSPSDIANDPLSAQYAEKNRENGTGMVRRYRTSVVGALQSSNFKEHMAEMTSMLLAQINAGHVNSPEQMNLARMISFNKSSKVGAFLLNDSFFYNFWTRILPCINNPEEFEKYFPDSEIALYRDQNGAALDGRRMALDENGNPYWRKINHTDPSITLEDKKNYIRHKVFPESIAKILGAFDRKISPNVSDSMKPENADALLPLLDVVFNLGAQNSDPSTPFEQRMDPVNDLLKDKDPNQLKFILNQRKAELMAIRNEGNPQSLNAQQKFLQYFKQQLGSYDSVKVQEAIKEIIQNKDFSDDSSCILLRTYCQNSPLLSSFSSEIDTMIENYLYGRDLDYDEEDEDDYDSYESAARNFASGGKMTREEFYEAFKDRFL